MTDAHVHINPWHQLRPEIAATLSRTNKDFHKFKTYADDPRAFLDLMDEDRIERACLINYVAPEVVGYTHETNAWVAKFASADRKRLLPFGSLHPAHVKDAKKTVDELLNKHEVSGIKIHGPHQLFAPNAYLEGEKTLRVLYERCQEEGVPVMFHTGTTVFPGARNKFGDPMMVDDVAVDFPDLKIILAHGGRPLWTETALFLVRRHANVWMDISSSPPASLLSYFPPLEKIADKVLFGSDWPGPHVPGMRANVDAFLALPLSEDAKRKIVEENARRLLVR